MPLIDIIRNIPVYALMRGTSVAAGTSTTALVPFANTFISSNLIDRTSAARVTVREKGYYEITLPLEIRALNGGGNTSISIQVGINGSFTTMVSSSVVNDGSGFVGEHSFILPMNADDYLEIKSVVNNATNGHTVYCNFGSGNSSPSTWFSPTITMKKL